MNPTVSVIVPYHNQEAFLAEAIESVQAQSLLDWELLLVDDGSQDAGPSIAERYARQDRRIRLLCHPAHKNMGAAASRNLGIQEAKGMFLAFLDGDDVYLPEKLEI